MVPAFFLRVQIFGINFRHFLFEPLNLAGANKLGLVTVTFTPQAWPTNKGMGQLSRQVLGYFLFSFAAKKTSDTFPYMWCEKDDIFVTENENKSRHFVVDMRIAFFLMRQQMANF